LNNLYNPISSKDHQKNQPTTLPEYYQKESGNRIYTEGVFRTISARSPHLLRRFSAIISGKGVEKVLKWCGEWGECMLIIP